MNVKSPVRRSVVYSVPFFVIASLLMSLSVSGKNSKGYNQAFNACTTKMENAYTDCLNMPYNSVEMCQNVANGVYKRCMRGKGYSVMEAPTVKTGADGKPQVNTGTGGKTTTSGSSPSPTPKRIKPLTDAPVLTTTTISKSSPTPSPKPQRQHEGSTTKKKN